LGPATGTSGMTDYLSSWVQPETGTTCYKQQNVTAATVSDAISGYPGVTSLSGISLSGVVDVIPSPALGGWIEETFNKAFVKNAIKVQHSNANIPGFFSSGDFKISNVQIQATPGGTYARWGLLTNEKQRRAVEIFVLPDHQAAIGQLRDHLSGYNIPVNQVFTSPKSSAQKGQFNLQTSTSYGIILLVSGNHFIRVSGDAPAEELDASLAGPLYKYINDGAVDPEQSFVPMIKSVSDHSGEVRVGEEIRIQVEVEDAGFLGVDNDVGNIIHIHSEGDEKAKTLSFLAVSPGEEKLFLSFAHGATLNTTSRTIAVKVVE